MRPPGEAGDLPLRPVLQVVLLAAATLGIYSMRWAATTWRETSHAYGREYRGWVVVGLAWSIWIIAVVALAMFLLSARTGFMAGLIDGLLLLFILAALAWGPAMALLYYGATRSAENWAAMRGAPEGLPPVVHALCCFILGHTWTVIGAGLVQRRLNAHAETHE